MMAPSSSTVPTITVPSDSTVLTIMTPSALTVPTIMTPGGSTVPTITGPSGSTVPPTSLTNQIPPSSTATICVPSAPLSMSSKHHHE